MVYKSEIRTSQISELLDKARKNRFKEYLVSIRLERIRKFKGAQINFMFPVTALIGPNGGGKSTIIGAAQSAYKSGKPSTYFRKSLVGDDNMQNWNIEYDLIDRTLNPSGSLRVDLNYKNDQWNLSQGVKREVRFLSINRTVPITESPLFSFRKRMSLNANGKNAVKRKVVNSKKVEGIDNIKIQAEKILGKSLSDFSLYEFQFRSESKQYKKEQIGVKTIGDGTAAPIFKKVLVKENYVPNHQKQYLYVVSDGLNTYSEFNFGAGETSIIRMVAEMESCPDSSLVLIEEVENGLHPVAVRRVVEYLIDLAYRKNLQVIFTTHSDYAISPLPSEAIWACVDGVLQQGKLSVESLRAVSGRIDRKLAIFVEDDFAKIWLQNIIREKLGNRFDEIGIYPVGGDGNAVKVHEGHKNNPAIDFASMCFIDGDSKQKENKEQGIHRLPGSMPELTVFNDVMNKLDSNIALLTAACHRPLIQQYHVGEAIRRISRTNRDPHLLYIQLGLELGFVPVEIIQGAFLSVWIQENNDNVDNVVNPILKILEAS